jgi:DNA-binding IclR family transcriptional regulator
VHDRIDAEVLAAFRRYHGEVVAKEQIAAETGYSAKTVDNACSRLRARGLVARPAQGRWRAVVGVAAGQQRRESAA